MNKHGCVNLCKYLLSYNLRFVKRLEIKTCLKSQPFIVLSYPNNFHFLLIFYLH